MVYLPNLAPIRGSGSALLPGAWAAPGPPACPPAAGGFSLMLLMIGHRLRCGQGPFDVRCASMSVLLSH